MKLFFVASVATLFAASAACAGQASNDLTYAPTNFMLNCRISELPNLSISIDQLGEVHLADWKRNIGAVGTATGERSLRRDRILNEKALLVVINDDGDLPALLKDTRMQRMYMLLQPASQSLEISEGTRLVYSLEDARSPAKIGELSCRVSGMYGE